MQDTSYDAIYARQSVDKADSISIESQIEFCRYETRGNPFRVYADKGYSGKNTDRPEFQRMLEDLRRGTIRRVICYKLDRCSRSILDFAALMEEFRKYGVEFVSCTEKFDTSGPMGRAMLNICIVFAQLERETIQQRVTDAYASRSRKGFYMGGRIPFGFRLADGAIEGKHTSIYKEEPSEAEILRLLFQRYAAPSASLGDVAASMAADGIRNPRRPDGKWIRSNLGKVLSNPIYVRADLSVYHYFKEKGVRICNDPQSFTGTNGCYLYKDPESGPYLVLAPHEGLICAKTWLQCRKKQGTSRKNTEKPLPPWYFLRGKLKCGTCGYALSITGTRKKNGKTYHYVQCSRSHGPDKSCKGIKGWKAEDLESLASDAIVNYLSAYFPGLHRICREKTAEQTALDIRVAQLQCEIDRSAEKILQSDNDILPYLNTHLQMLNRQKADLLRQFALLERTMEEDVISPDYPLLWNRLSPQEQYRVTDALLDHISVEGSLIRFFWKL